MNLKKTLISILCVLALFIPTYLAIASYVSNGDTLSGGRGIERMEIADPAGQTYKIAASAEGNDMVSLFNTMNENAVKRDELPTQLMGKPFYKVTYFKGKKSVDYKYYFSADAQNCYYVDNLGEVYQIKAEHAEKFVSTHYAQALYPDAVAPKLMTMSGDVITPANIVWNYRVTDGKFIPRSGMATEAGVLDYPMDGGVAFDFDIQPDDMQVKVYDGGTVLYDGSYDNLGSLNVTESRLLSFTVSAKWYEDAARNYYGTATYQFKANVVAPAEFYLGCSEIEPGDFVVLSGVNVADLSKISFSAEPAINYTPVFFADGKYVHALIPISYDLEASSYVFTVSYGITRQEINLKIKPKTFGVHNYDISETLIRAHRTPQTLAAFDAQLMPIAKAADSTRYFDGLFVDFSSPAGMNATITCGIGRYRTLLATGETYRHNGVDFYTAQGLEIPAANNGRIVYIGTTELSGKLVVIDHGYGLKSWYAHLSEISVSVGDTVTTGQTIGKTGLTGFTSMSGFHYGLSVFDVPVSPYRLWENGVEMHFAN